MYRFNMVQTICTNKHPIATLIHKCITILEQQLQEKQKKNYNKQLIQEY